MNTEEWIALREGEWKSLDDSAKVEVSGHELKTMIGLVRTLIDFNDQARRAARDSAKHVAGLRKCVQDVSSGAISYSKARVALAALDERFGMPRGESEDEEAAGA